jgi:glycosyltransferase involved in cell wall biosynthesis
MNHETVIPALADQRALAAAAGRLAARDAEIFFDISPLLDDAWTGIPVVAASLIRTLRPEFGARLRYIFRESEIDRDAVDDALARSTGLFLRYEVESGILPPRPLRRHRAGGLTIGLYPSVKSARRVFDFECSIIHDLSTLITPQFHMPENIAFHMEALCEDIASNAVTACVSQATAQDLVDYLGIAADRLVVAGNGISWRAADFLNAQSEVNLAAVEPFFLVLGTREPRKNIGLIVELLSLFPDLLNSHRFIITGRQGWLDDAAALPPALRGAVQSGRLFFTGFISDAEKCKLLMAAEATIYPSLFEGFGLPVIESLSVGTPCIASCSSSIPEAGGALCTYFDPYSVLDLYRAISEFKLARPQRAAAFRTACMDSVSGFTWTSMALKILLAIEAEMERLPR